MKAAQKKHKANNRKPPVIETWCKKGDHNLYERYFDFNEWFDGDDGITKREEYGIDEMPHPSKAFFAGDLNGYLHEFNIYKTNNYKEVLGQNYIEQNIGNARWFHQNSDHFEQLLECLIKKSVVPFVGAGISAQCGYPSWKDHLVDQGEASGLDPDSVIQLLEKGEYEHVIEKIEKKGYRDVFIKEIRNVFSRPHAPTETIMLLTELFGDTIITTNYDRVIENAFEKFKGSKIQLIESYNILEKVDRKVTTVIKLHGDIRQPSKCIISKKQYNEIYGIEILDLSKPIPDLLSRYYKNSNLLFLGCSLSRDRTMEVFQTVKANFDDDEIPLHFAFDSMPVTKDELIKRNAYLLSLGITPIWYPKGNYEYIEMILRLAKNEMRYRGY